MAFGAVEKLIIAIEATFKGDGAQKAKKELGNLQKEAEYSTRNLGKLAKGAAVVGGVLGTMGVAAKVAYDALKEGSALNTAANQFDILTAKINSTSDALLGRMREASQGFSTDAELIAAGNQIISLGLAKTEDDVANLAAVIGGLGLDMQQVILTFANNSKARLDSLGLSIEDVNAKVQELEQSGFQGDAFDAAVLELLTARYTEMSSAIDDTERAIRRAETAWSNFVDNAKRGFAANVGENILGFEQRRDDLKNLNQALDEGKISWAEYLTVLERLALLDDEPLRAVSEAVKEANREIQATGSFTPTAIAAWGEFLGLFGDPRNVFNLENTAERLEYLGRVADDSADGNYTYEVSAEQVAAAEEKRAAAHQRVAEVLQGGLAAAQERATARMDELAAAAEVTSERMREAFSDYIDSDGETAIEDVNAALYEQIKAAGADAETLAFAGVALGQFTEEQAKAALEQAALNAKLIELGEAVANGNLTIDQALEKFDTYRRGLQETEEQAQRNKDATIEYTDSINNIPEEKRTTLFVEKDSAVDAVEDLRRRLDDLPKSIDIDVNVSVPQIPEVYRPGGNQNYEGDNRATGGPVAARRPYLVGEQGPEMFVPSTNGVIVPNHAMGGSSYNISININAGGGGADRSLTPIVRDGVLEALQRIGAF